MHAVTMRCAWLKMAYVCATVCLISTENDANCSTMSVCWDPGENFLENAISHIFFIAKRVIVQPKFSGLLVT